MKLSMRIGVSAAVSTAVVAMMTRSIVIALAFGVLAAGIAFVTVRAKNQLNEASLIAAWPEVIDHLMSGIQSGLSLSESLAGLSTRGPEILRPAFVQFRATLYESGDLTQAIAELKRFLGTTEVIKYLKLCLFQKLWVEVSYFKYFELWEIFSVRI